MDPNLPPLDAVSRFVRRLVGNSAKKLESMAAHVITSILHPHEKRVLLRLLLMEEASCQNLTFLLGQCLAIGVLFVFVKMHAQLGQVYEYNVDLAYFRMLFEK